MKTIHTLLTIIVFSVASLAQSLDPVTWSFEVHTTDTEGQYELIATAQMADNWALYSQHTDPMGPVPTSFDIDTDGIALVDDVREVSEPIKKYSDLFEVETIKFKGTAVFKQTFTSASPKPTITGIVNYMTCDDMRCLPPKDKSFTAAL